MGPLGGEGETLQKKGSQGEAMSIKQEECSGRLEQHAQKHVKTGEKAQHP